MPGWKPDCLRGSVYEPDPLKLKERKHDQNAVIEDSTEDDRKGIAVIELYKQDGHGLGFIVSGGEDKGFRPTVSSIRPGGTAHRSDSLEVDDIILSVNGIKTDGMKHDEIINLLKNTGEHVILEVEYQLPDNSFSSSFSVCCKQHIVSLERDSGGFGFTLRGGYHNNPQKSRALTVTQIRPGGSADREGSIQVGDRIIAINEYNVAHFTLSEASMFLQQCGHEANFTVEYDMSVIDTIKNATGPLLVEIGRVPGTSLGLGLSQTSHQGKWCLSIDGIDPMSLADRCGALHVGDLIRSIEGTSVEHMSIAEATQLLKCSLDEVVTLEILPAKIVEQHTSRDIISRRGIKSNLVRSTTGSMSNAASVPAIPSSLSTPSSFNMYNSTGSAYNMSSGTSTLRLSGRKRQLTKRQPSNISISSTTTSIMLGNQIGRSETMEIRLYADYRGLGLTVDGSFNDSSVLGEAPVVSYVQTGSAADRCALMQEGDRILTVNGQSLSDKTIDEVNQLLRECRHRCDLEVEFDVTESVILTSGTFVVKLPMVKTGLGVCLSGVGGKANDHLIITDVKKGSVAHRCGSIQPGDKLLAINDVKTENMLVEDALHLLQSTDDIIKLRLKRDDPYSDDSGGECVMYTVEMQRRGGPLGITISGTDTPGDPIIISDLVEGGLAVRTGAIHIGDRLLAINGDTTRGKTLTEATNMLQCAVELVTLKIARPAETSKTKGKKLGDTCRSTTPVASVDSAMESWDSSAPETGQIYHNIGTVLSNGKPQLLPKPSNNKSGIKAVNSNNTDTSRDRLADFNQSDFEWENHSNSSHSENANGGDEWTGSFGEYENGSEMLKQINASLKQRSSASLDRPRSTTAKPLLTKNFSHSTAKDFHSEDELCSAGSRKKTTNKPGKKLGPNAYKEHVKTIFSPTPVQLHKIKMVKDPGADDFGFGLSDGMYEKGVYISGVRGGSLAEKAGLVQFDRILQVNGIRTRDFDCCLAIPLITEAGNAIDLVVCRNPIAKVSNGESSQKVASKPVREYNSCDEGSVYMNVPTKNGFNTPKSV
ncbi:glutamate receptor-interacting protein 2-like isoform X1 [Mytilus trossulus]|uniref:glutamate receptor-interacting protein 2-like isoform X1 n=1 Tax=Mytilus trossulus TaxID=6551 RepID=UPI0030060131